MTAVLRTFANANSRGRKQKTFPASDLVNMLRSVYFYPSTRVALADFVWMGYKRSVTPLRARKRQIVAATGGSNTELHLPSTASLSDRPRPPHISKLHGHTRHREHCQFERRKTQPSLNKEKRCISHRDENACNERYQRSLQNI